MQALGQPMGHQQSHQAQQVTQQRRKCLGAQVPIVIGVVGVVELGGKARTFGGNPMNRRFQNSGPCNRRFDHAGPSFARRVPRTPVLHAAAKPMWNALALYHQRQMDICHDVPPQSLRGGAQTGSRPKINRLQCDQEQLGCRSSSTLNRCSTRQDQA